MVVNPKTQVKKTKISHFLKENIQMAKKHMKRSSVSLAIRKMQIRTTMRYYLSSVKMIVLRKTHDGKAV